MQTVVGVFDTVDEAQRARDALVDSDFDASEVRVQSNPAAQSGETLTTTDRTITGTSRNGEEEGFMASIGHFFSNLFGSDDNEHAGHYSEAVRRGSTVVAVTVSEPNRVEQARSILSAAGAVDIDKRTESWREDGYSGFDASAQPYHPDQIAAERSRYQTNTVSASNDVMTPDGSRQVDQGTVLPVVREEIEVGKREVDLGTVRVFSRTETRPVEEQVELHEERADIERRPVDRPASEADLKAFEGGSIEIHETAERPVVSKTARVVEEVVVGTEASTRTETIKEQLRNTVVDVDKGDAKTINMGMSTDTGMAEPDYRSHYQANMASMGGSYDDYAPAYQYGYSLRSDPRYAERSWDEVEADARDDWTSRNPNGNSTWENTKQAIRHGWESMTGQR